MMSEHILLFGGTGRTGRSVMGVISAGDLSRLVVECPGDDSTIGQSCHTIDPAIEQQAPFQRGEDPLPRK